MRNRKIRRYGKDVVRRQQHRVLSVIFTVLIICAAGAAGWFCYPSVYDYLVARDGSMAAQPSPEASSQPSASSLPTSASEESAHEASGRYAYLPATMLHSASGTENLLANIAAQGFDGVAVDLKDESGSILYQSAAAASYAPQAVASGAYDLAALCAAAADAGLEVSGRICAFRDPLASRVMYTSAVKYNYTEINWLDNSQSAGGKPWLNPNDLQAQAYILALAEEAAVSGVERIIFSGVQFPTGYSLQLATYGEKGIAVNKSTVLSGFFVRAKNLLAQYGASPCFMTDISGVLGVSDVPYGKDIATVISSAGRVVLDLSPAQFGSSFVYDKLTLASPEADPYNTVHSTLALAELPQAQYIGWVQFDGAQAQIRAAGEYGIDTFIIYNPYGTYNG